MLNETPSQINQTSNGFINKDVALLEFARVIYGYQRQLWHEVANDRRSIKHTTQGAKFSRPLILETRITITNNVL